MKKVAKECDNCMTKLYLDDKYGRKYFKFCPNCGMDSDEEMPVKKGSLFRRWYLIAISIVASVLIWYIFYMHYPMAANEGPIDHILNNNLEFLLILFIPDIILIRDALVEPVCPSCRNGVKETFRYCPYCGIRRK